MKLSTSIMAHPDRVLQVAALQAALGADVPVAWDDEGPPKRDAERVWRTARRGWELHDPSADWHLLLQDDAVPAPDLLEALARSLRHVPPRALVSLYIGTVRPLPLVWRRLGARADEAGASWIVGQRSMWGVGVAVPVVEIPAMLKWCDRQHGLTDDMRVGRWAQRERIETWFPWPSLVNHPEDDSSLLGHGPGRRALRFTEGSALDWNPAGPVVR